MIINYENYPCVVLNSYKEINYKINKNTIFYEILHKNEVKMISKTPYKDYYVSCINKNDFSRNGLCLKQL